MTGPADPADLQLALALCDRADVITMAAFRRTDLVVETKADRTPVSEADREVELDIRAELNTARPGDRVVGEEYGDSGPSSSDSAGGPAVGPARRWIIDPIDGTKNFVRRIPVWATLLALEVDGVMSVGVVSAPALGRRWWAGRGLGAFAGTPGRADHSPISVSKVADLANAYATGTALSGWEGQGGPQGFVELAQRCLWDRNIGDFWSHVLVAEGCVEIGLDPIVSLWDLAALQVIVEEAGGTFTDLDGVARADGGSALSSNGLLHQEALSILKKTSP